MQQSFRTYNGNQNVSNHTVTAIRNNKKEWKNYSHTCAYLLHHNSLMTTIQVNFVLIPIEAGMRQHKFTWMAVIKLLPKTNHHCHFLFLAITWILQLFHSGHLCRAARLGRTLFYSLHSCFWVDTIVHLWN